VTTRTTGVGVAVGGGGRGVSVAVGGASVTVGASAAGVVGTTAVSGGSGAWVGVDIGRVGVGVPLQRFDLSLTEFLVGIAENRIHPQGFPESFPDLRFIPQLRNVG